MTMGGREKAQQDSSTTDTFVLASSGISLMPDPATNYAMRDFNRHIHVGTISAMAGISAAQSIVA